MDKISLIYTLNRIFLLIFIILCSLFVSANAFSENQKHWNRDYFTLVFNQGENALTMNFEFFDYHFGPANENGYLERCDYGYSTDGVNYIYFMRSETSDQSFENWSWVNMKNKLAGTQLQFDGCYVPASGTMWADNISMQQVEVYNYATYIAYLTIKWFMDKTYHDILFIRIIGKWHVNGVYPSEYFDEVYSTQIGSTLKCNNLIDYPAQNKTKVNTTVSEINAIKVSKEADAIVIKGADPGENINIYTTSGMQIKSIITTNEFMKINLPKNQIYIINIGQTRYKIAM